MLIEAVSFSTAGKIQPFLVTVSSNASLALDIHCHLKKEEVYGYLAGTWDLNTHSKFFVPASFNCEVQECATIALGIILLDFFVTFLNRRLLFYAINNYFCLYRSDDNPHIPMPH